ncbi:MAG: alanine racemase [Eubacteriales bacterium]|nr:alanine racemase [Eubacteriales bacterium]
MLNNDYVRRTWAEVSIDALEHNFNEIRSKVSGDAKILAVIKSDAYGHGVVQVANTLAKCGANCFAVAFVDEGVELRNNGIDNPIMLLGYTPLCQAKKIIVNNIQPAIMSYNMAKRFSEVAVDLQTECKIHIKVDTGMSRVGFVCNNEDAVEESVNDIVKIAKLPNIKIEGLFTHFAKADSADDSLTEKQFQRYISVADELEKRGINIPIKHVCNSAALIRYPHMHLDMVRAGIILYGVEPSSEIEWDINLQPVMQLKTTLAQIKIMHGDEGVSYGSRYTAEAGDIIGTIPVGYADGYSRNMSGKACVIAGGVRVPVVGTICMDQCMIKLNGVNNINVEDEVILFGRSGNTQVSIEEVAAWKDTIGYEILCDIGRRVPRVYTTHGKVSAVKNYLV